VVSGGVPQTGPILRSIEDARAGLSPDGPASARLVVDWFAALSDGRFDDAWAMMAPDGPYWLLRQRTAVANSEFGKIMAGLVGTTFTQPIRWQLGAITAQDDRVAVVAGSHVPLTAGGFYENLYHFLFRIEDGLIHDAYEFADTFRSAQTFAAPPGSK
jgi:ketosteroid isomerase-like protein